MADIFPINATGSTTGVPISRQARAQASSPAPEGTDCVEISEIAQLLSSLEPENQAQIRAQKVADIRQAIADGSYETSDKIDYVVSRLMDVLQEMPEEAVRN